MEAMKQMPDKAFDLAIVDPPYGIDVNMNMGVRAGERRKHERKEWDKKRPDAEYFEQLFRVSKNQIIWGANNLTPHIKPTPAWIFWDKQITGQVDFSGGELAWTSFEHSLKVFRHRIQDNYLTEPRIHPTQKPVKLYEWLLRIYAEPGAKILDTHLGSGSIAIACYNMGYNLKGYEIDRDYFEGALSRLNEHKKQGRLFDAVSV